MDALATELFERPFYILFALVLLEVALVVRWRQNPARGRALALAAAPLLAGAVLLTAHLVVTRRERIQQAVQEMVDDANAHRAAAFEKHLAAEVLLSLREGVEPATLTRQGACEQVAQALQMFDVHSVKTLVCKVDFPNDRSARMRLAAQVGYRHGGFDGTTRMEWTLRWAFRGGNWLIEEVRPIPSGGLAGGMR